MADELAEMLAFVSRSYESEDLFRSVIECLMKIKEANDSVNIVKLHHEALFHLEGYSKNAINHCLTKNRYRSVSNVHDHSVQAQGGT